METGKKMVKWAKLSPIFKSFFAYLYPVGSGYIQTPPPLSTTLVLITPLDPEPRIYIFVLIYLSCMHKKNLLFFPLGDGNYIWYFFFI